MRGNPTLKLILLGGLTFAFGIALVMVHGVVRERERYRDRVVAEVAASTARAQSLTGPLLVIGYGERRGASMSGPGDPGQVVDRQHVLLPESLSVSSRIEVEMRSRGIYRAPAYRSTHRLTGVFQVPSGLGLPAGADRASHGAKVAFGVSDSRGMRRPPVVLLDGAEVTVEPGTGSPWLAQGFSSPVTLSEAGAARIRFEIRLELVGTERLAIVPVGGITTVVMESDWPHPSFGGGFLPDTRALRRDGFRASWQLSRFGTGVADWIEARQTTVMDPAARRMDARPDLAESQELAVRFLQPVDVYSQSERAVKYGLLFVLLTFLAFFLYEVLRRLEVHPIQYALAGAAVALFFLLVISLSEHVPFLAAYVTASLACAGLLGFYVSAVLRSAARGLSFGALLLVLYALLYLLLQSEDYALLLGSLLLFAVLAAVMMMTRRVDWYRLGERADRGSV